MFNMLFLMLMVFGFHLTCGQSLETPPSTVQTPRTLNLKQYCIFRHFNGKYNFTCDGSSRHFKDKNLFLENTFGATGIELYSFESVTIVIKATSNWEALKKITIRKCKEVIINLESSLTVGELEVDSVDGLTLITENSGYNVTIKVVVLSNIKVLKFPTNSKNGGVDARKLYLTNISDIDVYGNLRLGGELLTISQSYISVTQHSVLLLNFASISTKDISKLYIEARSQFNISTDELLIKESEIYIDGQVNIKDYKSIGKGSQKEIKFLNNSFYGIKQSHLNIYGDKNISFLGNGIYKSDLGDILDLIGGKKDVDFTKNKFDCNECAKRQTIPTKYLEFLEGNFCDLTCNLTLQNYIKILNQELICNNGDSYVNGEVLCSTHPHTMKVEHRVTFINWIVIAGGVVSVFLLSSLIFFYCKRHSPKFRPISMENRVIPEHLSGNQDHSGVVARAFSNEIYGRDDGYEVIDLPS